MLDTVTKAAGGIFGKIIKFVTMTLLGSVINRIVSILKDPAQLLDPIKQFFNVFIGMFNSVVKQLWDITGAPINFVLNGINAGVKSIIDGINSVSGLLLLPKIDPPQIPLIPGPPQVPMIPLSKTAQAKNEGAVGMSGGGLVAGNTAGADGKDGVDGKDGIAMAGGGLVLGYEGGGEVLGSHSIQRTEDGGVLTMSTTGGVSLGGLDETTTSTFRRTFTEADGTVTTLEEKEKMREQIASIGVPDLIEHQDQLLSEIHKLKGFENVTIDQV